MYRLKQSIFHSRLTSGKFIPLKSTSKILWVAYKSIFPIWTLVLVKLSRLTIAAMQKKDKLFIFPLMPTSHDQLHLKMLRHLQAYSTNWQSLSEECMPGKIYLAKKSWTKWKYPTTSDTRIIARTFINMVIDFLYDGSKRNIWSNCIIFQYNPVA